MGYIFAFLMSTLVPIIINVLITFGVGVTTFTGITLAFDWIETNFFSQMESLPADVFAIAVRCGLDQYFAIVFSAMLAGLAIKTVNGGQLKKLGFTGASTPTV